MTVAELIKRLQKEQPELIVVVPGPDHSFRVNIGVYVDVDRDYDNKGRSRPVLVIE